MWLALNDLAVQHDGCIVNIQRVLQQPALARKVKPGGCRRFIESALVKLREYVVNAFPLCLQEGFFKSGPVHFFLFLKANIEKAGEVYVRESICFSNCHTQRGRLLIRAVLEKWKKSAEKTLEKWKSGMKELALTLFIY